MLYSLSPARAVHFLPWTTAVKRTMAARVAMTGKGELVTSASFSSLVSSPKRLPPLKALRVGVVTLVAIDQ